MAKNLLLVYSNAVDGKEAEFHDWYDRHVLDISRVKGFLSAQRFEIDPERSESSGADQRRFLVLYELDVDAGAALTSLRAAAIAGEVERPDMEFVGADIFSQVYAPIRGMVVAGALEER